MSYSEKSSSIGGKVTSLDSVVANVNKLDFKGVWKGAAGEKLCNSLVGVMNRLNKEKTKLNTFKDALSEVDKLIAIDKKISKLQQSLNGLDPEEDASEISSIRLMINKLNVEKENLKTKIINMLNTISPTSSEVSLSYSNTASFDYICNIEELEEKIKKCYVYNGNVAKLYNDVQSNGLSGMDYVNSQLDSVLNSYSGREATVNSALMSLKLAADKGVKYRYINSGSNGHNGVKYNTNEQMIDGMDCCAYVSWAVNKGTADPFHWEGVGGFRKIGNEIDISQALPGDVLVNDKHVAMIVANNPETGQITIVESGGLRSDVHMVTYGYNNIRGSFSSGTYPKVKSLEDYYTGAKSNA